MLCSDSQLFVQGKAGTSSMIPPEPQAPVSAPALPAESSTPEPPQQQQQQPPPAGAGPEPAAKQQSLASFREMLDAALLDEAALDPYLPAEEYREQGSTKGPLQDSLQRPASDALKQRREHAEASGEQTGAVDSASETTQ